MAGYPNDEPAASAEAHSKLAFGKFILDMGRGILLSDGEVVPLRPKSFDLLRYLVEHAGKLVSKEEIFDAVWPDVVVTPDSINQCIIEVRKALGDDAHELIRTVPRRGYVFEGVVAVLHPNGHKTDDSGRDEGEPTSPPSRSWFRELTVAAILALVVAVVYLYFPESREPTGNAEKQQAAEGFTPEAASIAVLPFEDMSQQQDQEYFAEGLSESLLDLLAKVPELRVISRVSAFSFKGKEETIPDIAKQLNVAHILEGSVRVSGDRVRVATQLIDARTDVHLWSETYDRPIGDIFAIQDDISARVVKEMKVKLLGQPAHAQETDPEAYTLYLKAKAGDVDASMDQLVKSAQVRSNDGEDIEASIDKLVLAVNIDPKYTPAWILLGARYVWKAFHTMNSQDWQVDASLARTATERALALDPQNAQVQALLGTLATMDDDVAGAAKAFETALAIDANDPLVLSRSARLLNALGRFDEAAALLEKVIERDPLNLDNYAGMWVNRMYARKFGEAEAICRHLLSLEPDYWLNKAGLGLTLAFEGKYQEALDAVSGLGPNIIQIAVEAYAYQQLGKTEEFRAVVEFLESAEKEFETRNPGKTAVLARARFYAMIGDADEAFRWLETLRLQESHMPFALEKNWPFYQAVRNDPRWEELLVKAGVSAAQLSEIKFSVNPQQKASASD